MTAKKKRLIIISIIVVMLLITVGVVNFCITKYKAGQRYLQYEELESTQIVLIQENHSTYDGEYKINIRALDAEGNLYSAYVSPKEWEGIEHFYDEIVYGDKIVNYVEKEDMDEIYGYILEMTVNENSTYDVYPTINPATASESTSSGYYYGIKYCGNGVMEYIRFWSGGTNQGYIILRNGGAREIYEMFGDVL